MICGKRNEGNNQNQNGNQNQNSKTVNSKFVF